MTEEEREVYNRETDIDAQLVRAAVRRFAGKDLPSQEEWEKLPLAARAYWNGIGKAASWETDYKHIVDTVVKHTNLSRSEALLFLLYGHLKNLCQ